MHTNALPNKFTNQEFDIEVIPEGISFKILAPGLARALGFRDASNLVASIPDSEKGYTLASTPGGDQHVYYLTEPSFYRALGQRQAARVKDEHVRARVERFQNWVYTEVLPQIRRDGAYMTPEVIEKTLINPDFIISLATKLKDEQEKNRELQAENHKTLLALETARPKVLFADAVATSKTSILIGEFAKILKGNGVEIGQNRLFQWLRENGYLCKAPGDRWNMPTQKSLDLGLFRIKESTTQSPDGDIRVHKTPKLTGKGQQYFADKFLTRAIVDIAGEAVAS